MENINIIGIDPSIISTAMTLNGKNFNYIKESYALNKNGLTKWYKVCEELVSYRYLNFIKNKNYSEGEILKLEKYNEITDMIISDIINNINRNKPTIIGIEGYSYGSKNGDLIDLVTFSTLLRNKLYNITKNIVIFSPSTLKLLSCKLTYEPIINGKKIEFRNNEGVSGGKFTKKEIYKSIIENKNNNSKWVELMREYSDEVLSMKSIKKPFDDVGDSFNIYNIIKNELNEYDPIKNDSYEDFIKKLQIL